VVLKAHRFLSGLTPRRVAANLGVMNESLGLTSHNSSATVRAAGCCARLYFAERKVLKLFSGVAGHRHACEPLRVSVALQIRSGSCTSPTETDRCSRDCAAVDIQVIGRKAHPPTSLNGWVGCHDEVVCESSCLPDNLGFPRMQAVSVEAQDRPHRVRLRPREPGARHFKHGPPVGNFDLLGLVLLVDMRTNSGSTASANASAE
jgi:hypothetical protein